MCLGNGKVVVVGGGLAGLSAAIEATQAGSSVVILEKAEHMGGNSAKASSGTRAQRGLIVCTARDSATFVSGINGTHTVAQIERHILDSYNALRYDTIRSGAGYSDLTMVDTLAAGSEDAIPWLRGFGLSLNALSHCGGHSVSGIL
jgi:succinate dehydrogenase/fumarate reductase flavoprotein subunit